MDDVRLSKDAAGKSQGFGFVTVSLFLWIKNKLMFNSIFLLKSFTMTWTYHKTIGIVVVTSRLSEISWMV